jgi:hypothetical protein
MSSPPPTGKFLQFFEPKKILPKSQKSEYIHELHELPPPTEKFIQFFEPKKILPKSPKSEYIHELHELPRPLSISWDHVIA